MAKYNLTGPDGKVYSITAPSGASREEILGRLEQYTTSIADPKAETVSIGEDVYDYPNMPKRGIGRSANAPRASANVIRTGVDKLRDAIGRSPAAYQRAKDAKDLAFTDKAQIALGEEMSKLGVGAADLADIALGSVGFDSADERRVVRKKEQSDADELMNEFHQVEGLAGISRMAPYLASGYALGPVLESAIGKTGLALGRGGKLLSSGTLGRVAPRMNRSIQNLGRSKAKPSHLLKGGSKTPTMVLADAGTGLVESGIHYDDSVAGGIASSVAGGALGRRAAPAFEQAPNMNTDNLNRILDKFEDASGDVPPGLRTGQPKYQTMEAGMSGDDRYSQLAKETQIGNQQVVNEMAGDAIGFEGKALQDISPAELKGHVDNLKSQYEDIENATSAVITRRDLKNATKRISKLGSTETSKGNKATLKAKLKDIAAIAKPGEGEFSGSEYKTLRRGLVDEGKKATNDGNDELYRELKEIVNMLDSGMEKGIKTTGSGVSSSDWKDLREKYALTKLLMNEGMGIDGSVDLNKLGTHMMSKDAERTLMEQGGRITDLQELAKLEAGIRAKEGSGLTGTGIHQVNEKATEASKLLTTPKILKEPLHRRAMYGTYMSGYPASTGLAFLRPEWRAVEKASRASQQGSEPYSNAAKYAGGKVADIADVGSNALEELMLQLGIAPARN